MSMQVKNRKAGQLLGVFAGVALWLAATPAFATKIGNIWIIKNTTLTEDVIGSIEFKHGNITLDCQGHSVRFDASYSPQRCTDVDGYLQSCGISSNGFDDITIRNCRVWDANFGVGIWVGDSNRPTILSSSAYGAVTGIHLESTTSAYISLATQGDSNDGLGLALLYATDSYIAGNLFSYNNRHGIYELEGSFNEIVNNKLSFNSYSGYYSQNSEGAFVSRNGEINSNGTTGIHITGGVGFLVKENVAKSNRYGIRVLGSSHSIEVSYNTAQSNTTYDAAQSSDSTGNYWHHNTFGTRKNVPAQ